MTSRANLRVLGSSVVATALLVTGLAWTLTPPSGGAPARVPAAAIDPGLSEGAVDTPVIVQARPGRTAAALDTAAQAGARIGQPLAIVDGFAARVSGPAIAALRSSPDVVAVTVDRSGAFQSTQPTDDTGMEGTAATEDRASQPSVSAFTEATGASAAWSAGVTGAGVTVAVLDTGISPMPDLIDHTIPGPDLSGEDTFIDTYGHGTVMAGIIAGDGGDSNTLRRGVAPDARLVSVKVAGRNGAVDVSTVLAGLTWISAYRQQLGIRVLNLSYGTTSTQSPAVDPLNFAVQRLWNEGVVVVVAAGNGGPGPQTITKPGDDPVVLTVGAYDDHGDSSARNDTVPEWSSRGPTAQGVAKPDIVAPGRSVVASRSYGSAVEAENPSSLVSPSYMKGSGTSEAAAVTSGLAALLLQARPTWTPDQVKQALMSTASPFSQPTPDGATGRGRPHVMAAIATDPGPPVQQTITATGIGSLEASRGEAHVVTGCGLIQGERDVFCNAWNPAAFTGSSWSGSSWSGSSWSGSSWSGSSWSGSSWSGSSWSGSSWSGSSWSGSSWSGSSWSGSSWSGSSWSGSSWSGSSWSGSSWSGSSWSDASWGQPAARPDGRRGTLTAFWGDRPAHGADVAGEQAAP